VDSRSPFVLSTHDLGRRPGSMRPVKKVVGAPGDLGTDLVGIEEGSEVELDLRLEAVMEGVLVSGTVRGRVVGECGRCLGPLDQALTVELQELFVYPGHEAPEGEEELPELSGELLDLEPTLRDAVVTALPFQPVCRPDCPGLCPECGIPLAEVVGEHTHEVRDPRWAALGGLARGDAVEDN
jgi:uncharacterized protein